MALLAAREAAGGAPSVEISVTLAKYYLSFRERRQTFKIDPRMCMGPPDAKVTLMEFSDFECPYCSAARPVLEKFVKESEPKVRLCFAPFPLPAHPHAMQAAQAALYARDHGKFWPMHDALFEKQSQLSDETIRGLAEKLGMSRADLGKALESGKLRVEVEASTQLGVSAGVDGTPAIFVNGRRLSLLISPEVLSITLQDELEWMNNHNAWVAD
jgi:protein-disulfide isomerase